MIRGIICIFFVACLVGCFAEEIKFNSCTDSDPKDWCKVNKIVVEPCKEAASNKPCNLKKGKSYSMKIDYIALKPIETMKSLPYWAALTGDVPFAGMNDTACSFTQCPIAENAEQTYDFQLKIAKSLPRGQFDVKWKFYADGNENNGCCVRFYLKLV